MAEESNKDQSTGQSSTTPSAEKKDNGAIKKKQRGLLTRVWRGIFRSDRDDFEKRLQYISKEEAVVMSRIKKRTQAWRRLTRNFLMFSVVFELVAVGYAIMTTRSLDLNWKMRAARVLPMFLLPVLSYLTYSTLVTFTKMRDRRDQKTLEMLRAERQAKIDELKERTNYYSTQQLIQRYDPDPAAKAAAATFLAAKMGADSGLKVHMGDESKVGKSNEAEMVQSSGLRNRKQTLTRSSSTGSSVVLQHHEETHGYTRAEGGPGPAPDLQTSPLVVVDHHDPRSSASNDGGWIAQLAALLVGEDPTQSYALICGNCHMHNGLAMKEDYPFVTYYCPHCHALNRSKQSSGIPTPGTNSPTTLTPLPSVAEGDVSDDSGVVTAAAAVVVETTTVVSEEEEPTVLLENKD